VAGTTPLAYGSRLLLGSGYNSRANGLHFAAGCHSLAKLATSYLLALSEKQPFQSGNLAIDFLVAITFLRVNGRVFSAEEVSAAEDTANVVDGKCPESYYTHWLYAQTCG
jgi:prophage maintenance system killer protein